MLLIETNRVQRLLHLSYIGHVQVADLRLRRAELEQLLVVDLPAGFRLLADLSHLERMDLACEAEIAQTMELCNRKGVELVVRVVPDPERDIGLNILSAFHYDRRVRVVTSRSLQEALTLLQKAPAFPAGGRGGAVL